MMLPQRGIAWESLNMSDHLASYLALNDRHCHETKIELAIYYIWFEIDRDSQLKADNYKLETKG